MLIDLQLHSTYSDGYLTPTELVKFIAGNGVKIAALTDHNTVGGLDEFRHACRVHRIKPITGLELYIKLGAKKIGLLWFNFNETDPELHKVLRNSQIRRRNVMRKALENLTSIGFKIKVEKILDKYTHYTPINRVVDEILAIPANRARIKKELESKNPTEGEVISEYFYNKEIGKLHESCISIERILKLRDRIGGQLVLNHPGKHNHLKKELIEKIKKLGIDGIEVFSPHHSIGSIMCAQFRVHEFDLIATGGSDFHRHERGRGKIKNCYDYFKIDSKYLRGVDKIIK